MMPLQFALGERPSVVRNGVRSIWAVIGPGLAGDAAEGQAPPARPGTVAVLCLVASAALLLVVLGQGAGRRGEAGAALLVWSGILLLVVPATFRIAWPRVARGERLLLLLVLAEALFYCTTVYAPTNFMPHDAYLHRIAAEDILTARRLFLSNPLLEVGSTYLALEILATALADVTRLSLFAASMVLLALLRGTFVAALFLLYERLSGSARIAAIGCLAYMGCSTFFNFMVTFSYESLGIVLCALAFAVEAASREGDDGARSRALVLIGLLLACIAVTHHLSSAYAAIYFGGVAVLELLRRGGPPRETRLAVGAILAVALPLVWMELRGTHLAAYLGPVVETGVKTLLAKLHGPAPVRQAASEVPSQPLFMRAATLLGVLLTAAALATGFFRTLARTTASAGRPGWPPVGDILARRWLDSRVVLLALLAFGFPVSVAFRLSGVGWEIGNRMGTLAFFGVGLVVATAVVHFWQGRRPQGWRLVVPLAALAVIVTGGVTSGTLSPIRGPYRVGADAESVEQMALGTARWTREWLGPGNRFAADRVNRLLLAGDGRQDVRLDIAEGVNASRVFRSEDLSPDDFWALARSEVDYLLVDLRLTTAMPVLGFYFEPWEARDGRPISPDALLKFNDIDGVTRIYDNGYILIYDVRGLHGRR